MATPPPARRRPAGGHQALEEAQEGKADHALECLTESFEAATVVVTLPAKYRKRLHATDMFERFIGGTSWPEMLSPCSCVKAEAT